MNLKEAIEEAYRHPSPGEAEEELFWKFIKALERGEIRAAEKRGDTWETNTWVKEGILLGFRLGKLMEMGWGGEPVFVDKHTFPPRRFRVEERVRLVPGGSSVRRGSYVAPGVVIMPPAYINVGAYVDEGTMVDSHALVGSCAQVGRQVHISAGCQIGGVLEPVGAVPVVIEDEVMLGGCSGIFEGTRLGRRAVIGAGVILTRSTPVYDLVQERVLRGSPERPLEIPEGAVVVAGSRPARGRFAETHGLQLYTPVIVKYRDEKTDAATALEAALR